MTVTAFLTYKQGIFADGTKVSSPSPLSTQVFVE